MHIDGSRRECNAGQADLSARADLKHGASPGLAEILDDDFVVRARSLNLSIIIYGSYAYGTQTPASDLDVLMVGSGPRDSLRSAVIEIVMSAQHRLGLPIDDEVPIETKVLAGWDDLAEAATGCHFYAGPRRTMPAIKPVEKTAAYLGCREMCLRLWQNILVGKTVALCDQPGLLRRLQLHARRAMITLYRDVMCTASIDMDRIVDWLIGTGDSDLWLGFRDCREVREFLRHALPDAIA